jgi:hypothetical protein
MVEMAVLLEKVFETRVGSGELDVSEEEGGTRIPWKRNPA